MTTTATYAALEAAVGALCQRHADAIDSSPVEGYEFDVTADATRAEVRTTVSRMYSLDGFANFEFLSALSELLNTKRLDLTDEDHSPGCESCDWGSSSSVTVVARDVPRDVLGYRKEAKRKPARAA